MSKEKIFKLASRYAMPGVDALMIALNCSGIKGGATDNNRIRFKFKPNGSHDEFYMALCVDTTPTSFSIRENELFLDDQLVGYIINIENDTCTESYFRRQGTSLTLNSNSRSQCVGCKFCGTYNLSSEDKQPLVNESYLYEYLSKIMAEKSMPDLSLLEEVAVCTGCFKSENDLVTHLLALKWTLTRFNFQGEIKYIGSQLISEEKIRLLKEEIGKFALYFTVECFTRREELLRQEKRISLEKIKSVLTFAKNIGIETSIIYILGLEPLQDFAAGIGFFKNCLTRFPILNVMQNYVPEQEDLKDSEAKSLEYFLAARQLTERIYEESGLKPLLWEGYRNLWYTAYDGQPLSGIKI